MIRVFEDYFGIKLRPALECKVDDNDICTAPLQDTSHSFEDDPDKEKEVTIDVHEAEMNKEEQVEKERLRKQEVLWRKKFILGVVSGILVLMFAVFIRAPTKTNIISQSVSTDAPLPEPTDAPLPQSNPSPAYNSTPTPTPSPDVLDNVFSPLSTEDLYCFPSYRNRKRYTKMWSNYTVEVKASSGDALCGPGDNRFSTEAVSVAWNTLTMRYMKVGDNWEASEVRVLLPQDKNFTYGTYRFSVKSVSVVNTTDSTVVSSTLPDNLVLGLFTWNDEDQYAIHENWNHEVDIEISRWSKPNDADVQFLVQPVDAPSRYRFYSGVPTSLDPGGHTYEFKWNPGKIVWSTTAGGGLNHTYETKTSIVNGVEDYIQCLPIKQLEVRINLWNSQGAVAPSGFLDAALQVQVQIDNFSFTPSGLTFVPSGGYCSKDCMCEQRCRNTSCV